MTADIVFYDFEVFKYDWIVCFRVGDITFPIHNNKEQLRTFIKDIPLLVGFNNYNYDDLILFALVVLDYDNEQLYQLSQDIVNDKYISFKNKVHSSILTLDCMQELPLNVSLKSIECNLGKSIEESTVAWNINRPLNQQEMTDIIKYCSYDVEMTEQVFKLREDYFKSKIDMCNEFNLNYMLLKKTRAHIVPEILKSKSIKTKDRLNFKLVPNFEYNFIPAEIKDFYENIRQEFITTGNYEELEKRKLKTNICEVDLTFGFGGLHGDIKKLIYKGNILYIDVNSYYPSLMIVYAMLSRSCQQPELFENIYKTRFELKSKKDTKEYIYKITMNSTFGASKDKYNKLFDPLQANNICINGQLLLTHLMVELGKYSKILQVNTDGIILGYEDKHYDKLQEIINDWEIRYNLKLGQKLATELYQRDVNNYIIKFKDGSISCKGMFKNYNINKINYESNSLSIIDIALFEYYINNKEVEDTVDELLNNKVIVPFQLVVKLSNKYEKLAQKVGNEYIDLPNKVNRVFATNKLMTDAIYKVKNENGVEKYELYTNTPKHTYIYNESLDNFDTSILDKNYYIDLVNSYKIENMKLKTKKKDTQKQTLFEYIGCETDEYVYKN